jgi:hypothetical protein
LKKGAAVNPEEYREFGLGCRIHRGPDIEKEAVLALLATRRERFTLKSRRAEIDRLADALPRRRWSWSMPSFIADWGGCIGNPSKNSYSFPLLALHLPLCDPDGVCPDDSSISSVAL